MSSLQDATTSFYEALNLVLKGDAEQIRSILGAVKSMGVAEVAKRLAA